MALTLKRRYLPSARMATHYEVLEVSRNATLAEIKKAYFQLSLKNHPDKTQGLPDTERVYRQEIQKSVNNAWDVLSDPKQKKEYDSRLLKAGNGNKGQYPRSQPPQRSSDAHHNDAGQKSRNNASEYGQQDARNGNHGYGHHNFSHGHQSYGRNAYSNPSGVYADDPGNGPRHTPGNESPLPFGAPEPGTSGPRPSQFGADQQSNYFSNQNPPKDPFTECRFQYQGNSTGAGQSNDEWYRNNTQYQYGNSQHTSGSAHNSYTTAYNTHTGAQGQQYSQFSSKYQQQYPSPSSTGWVPPQPNPKAGFHHQAPPQGPTWHDRYYAHRRPFPDIPDVASSSSYTQPPNGRHKRQKRTTAKSAPAPKPRAKTPPPPPSKEEEKKKNQPDMNTFPYNVLSGNVKMPTVPKPMAYTFFQQKKKEEQSKAIKKDIKFHTTFDRLGYPMREEASTPKDSGEASAPETTAPPPADQTGDTEMEDGGSTGFAAAPPAPQQEENEDVDMDGDSACNQIILPHSPNQHPVLYLLTCRLECVCRRAHARIWCLKGKSLTCSRITILWSYERISRKRWRMKRGRISGSG